MHTIYKGIAAYHLNSLLHHLIDKCHYLTLDQLNHVIKAIHTDTWNLTPNQLPSTESPQAPSILNSNHSGINSCSTIRISIITQLLHSSFSNDDTGKAFPHKKLYKREENHWECFLLLWNICSVATAF